MIQYVLKLLKQIASMLNDNSEYAIMIRRAIDNDKYMVYFIEDVYSNVIIYQYDNTITKYFPKNTVDGIINRAYNEAIENNWTIEVIPIPKYIN